MEDIEVNLDCEEWKQFKEKFNKSYSDENEEIKRYKMYMKTKQMADEHNEKYEKGEVSYKMTINKFADLQLDEVRSWIRSKQETSANP